MSTCDNRAAYDLGLEVDGNEVVLDTLDYTIGDEVVSVDVP